VSLGQFISGDSAIAFSLRPSILSQVSSNHDQLLTY